MTSPLANSRTAGAWAVALALVVFPVSAARAEQTKLARPAANSAKRPPPPEAKPHQQPLSPEDSAVVRDLELLENAELLSNLELFEEAPSGANLPPTATPTAGAKR